MLSCCSLCLDSETYGFNNFQQPTSITMIGTVKQKHRATCISWSPKGKQLVAGDIVGQISQYKPEMVLIRTIPAPDDAVSLQGKVNITACSVKLRSLTSQCS